ncbi:hypothetical protein GGR51DRAFT_557439 [Nemania sp. FL0031]|nr:hypothetical protein GGR51DRAFT_557439 [Nemania sp. FL0031]
MKNNNIVVVMAVICFLMAATFVLYSCVKNALNLEPLLRLRVAVNRQRTTRCLALDAAGPDSSFELLPQSEEAYWTFVNHSLAIRWCILILLPILYIVIVALSTSLISSAM